MCRFQTTIVGKASIYIDNRYAGFLNSPNDFGGITTFRILINPQRVYAVYYYGYSITLINISLADCIDLDSNSEYVVLNITNRGTL